MNLNKQRSFFKFWAVPAAALIGGMIIVGSGTGIAAETGSRDELPPLPLTQPIDTELPTPSGALTPPPPVAPYFENFNWGLSADKYLSSTYSNLSAAGSSSVHLFSSTAGTSAAIQTGVTVHLEQWTGSGWIPFQSSRSSSSFTSLAALKYMTDVTQGYYYRMKSDHWASRGISRDTNSVYSNTVLVSS